MDGGVEVPCFDKTLLRLLRKKEILDLFPRIPKGKLAMLTDKVNLSTDDMLDLVFKYFFMETVLAPGFDDLFKDFLEFLSVFDKKTLRADGTVQAKHPVSESVVFQALLRRAFEKQRNKK